MNSGHAFDRLRPQIHIDCELFGTRRDDSPLLFDTARIQRCENFDPALIFCGDFCDVRYKSIRDVRFSPNNKVAVQHVAYRERDICVFRRSALLPHGAENGLEGIVRPFTHLQFLVLVSHAPFENQWRFF